MNLHVEVHGHGPVPLVLLHGWAMHGGVFALLVEALMERCTMYVVDLPGHGYSRSCSIALEPQACARAIAAVTPPAAWLGWSLGGLIAMMGALQTPQHVSSLAMLCATPRFVRAPDWPFGNDASMVQQLGAELETHYAATIDRFLALEVLGSADPRGALRHLRTEVFARGEPDVRALQQGIEILEQTDLRNALSRLPPGSTWIAGRLDRLVHPEAMQWSAAQSAGAFSAITHAGHAPFLTHADAVAQALTPWLEAIA